MITEERTLISRRLCRSSRLKLTKILSRNIHLSSCIWVEKKSILLWKERLNHFHYIWRESIRCWLITRSSLKKLSSLGKMIINNKTFWSRISCQNTRKIASLNIQQLEVMLKLFSHQPQIKNIRNSISQW